ncbi:MAG: hypothetical protein CMO66_00165 [Verrucomicrobiales bacterium]|nr:hypothetical protein [Verrucomicrobiales bacterium]|tara:strand:+ start:3218 stop:4156 length:939 start_codon:yes stop_codon:yes gene_type:complete
MTHHVHPSARPETRRQAMLMDLKEGQLPSALLYESPAQARRWLAVHEAFSPARINPACNELYHWIARQVAAECPSALTQVIGLGCGGGLKDAMILDQLQTPTYWALDISEDLTCEAIRNSPAQNNHSCLLDLANADDPGKFLRSLLPDGLPCIFTLFGVIPNFPPKLLARQLSQILRPGDWLLLSANLAPGRNYVDGVARIMPQYDNQPTRDWILGALKELDITKGELVFSQAASESGLRRIEAHWIFNAPLEIICHGTTFRFAPGDSLLAFYSNRHTTALVLQWLGELGVCCRDHRALKSGEEAVFLCHAE